MLKNLKYFKKYNNIIIKCDNKNDALKFLDIGKKYGIFNSSSFIIDMFRNDYVSRYIRFSLDDSKFKFGDLKNFNIAMHNYNIIYERIFEFSDFREIKMIFKYGEFKPNYNPKK